jgi:hypothetical protein
MRATLIAILVLLTATPAAGAASIAYVDGGEVWLSSLDGARKARLAPQAVNPAGETEKWLAVAASDSGRIVAARNFPGRNSSFSWFKVWEPDGTSTVEGPLNAPSGFATYTYPLGFDLTANGNHMVYGYSNTGFCCPMSFARGTYVRPVTSSSLNPIDVNAEHPTLFGSRIVAHSGGTISVQGTSAPPYGDDLAPWLDVSGTGFELRRTDVAANGGLAAFELEQWDGGSQTVGKIGVIATQGVDQPPAFPAAVDCYLPASGVAGAVSLSLDATRVAWIDDQGLKVAGTPTTAADPCALSAPPVTISPTASEAAIGGADVTAFLPAPAPASAPPPGGAAPPTGSKAPTGRAAAPVAKVPSKVTTKALAGAKGVAIKVRVARAGKIKLRGTVPARILGRKGKPVVVAAGSATAKRAGTVTVRLRLTAAARKRPGRLKGARMTLRITHRGTSTVKRITLR